jgi:hypothetical protein
LTIAFATFADVIEGIVLLGSFLWRRRSLPPASLLH